MMGLTTLRIGGNSVSLFDQAVLFSLAGSLIDMAERTVNWMVISSDLTG